MSESDQSDQKLPEISPPPQKKKLESDDQDSDDDDDDDLIHMPPKHSDSTVSTMASDDSASNSQKSNKSPNKRGKPMTARKHTSAMYDAPRLGYASTRQTARKSTSPLNRMRVHATSHSRNDMPRLNPPIEYDRADDFEPTIPEGK